MHYLLHINIWSSQSAMYYKYMHHVTYKGYLGIAPPGAITFLSVLYEGSVSDKEIVKRSGILNKSLWDDIDSIMADRGFTIQNELAPLNGIFLHSFVTGLS